MNRNIEHYFFHKKNFLEKSFCENAINELNKNDDCIKFLLDIQFSKILKRDNIKVVQAIDTKNDILNLLNQCRNFNLSNSAVLQYFKTHPDYVQ